MCSEISSSLSYGDQQTFRATHLWQELVLGFRMAMPRCKHRLKMRWYDDSFTAKEAAEWLHAHLRASGSFRDVSRGQAVKLLQKFLTSDVITEVRGKLAQFEEDSSYLYKLVTEPGPFNFIEDTSPTSSGPSSPVSKRGRCSSLYVDRSAGACFTNEYAFMRCEGGAENESPMKGVSPLKRSRSDDMLSKHLAVKDTNKRDNELSAYQIAAVWKEVTLSRLLRLVELPTLDGVMDHNAVDGKEIIGNASLSGRSLLDRAAARFRRSVKPDKKPPLPPPSHSSPSLTAMQQHTLTTTPHHTHRFSTRVKSDSQFQTHSEAVSDVPHWVVLAMKCLSKWPDACTEELVGGMPVYCGFELDVLLALVQYFRGLAEPLISSQLYDLHMAVHSLLANDKPGVIDALKLCTLLLPQTNRSRLHRMLRFINKASANSQLVLCRGVRNKDELLKHFTSVILRSSPAIRRVEARERGRVEALVSFMAQHYQQIFKVPDDLKKEVHKRLDAIASGKEDFVPQVSSGSCSQLSAQEYEDEGRRSSQDALLQLLDTIIADQTMSSKEKRQKLRDFQMAYPNIYSQRLPVDPPSPKHAHSARKPRRHTSRSFSCQTRPSHAHLNREKSDSSGSLDSGSLDTVVMR